MKTGITTHIVALTSVAFASLATLACGLGCRAPEPSAAPPCDPEPTAAMTVPEPAEPAAPAEPAVSAETDAEIMQRTAAELAEAMPSPGLQVGEKAPDFRLPNAVGEDVSLYEALADGPVVLTFYRGAWCPFCNTQLRGLQQTLPDFERYGARLIAVTPQQPDWSREQIEKEGLAFDVLSDVGGAVSREYRLEFAVAPELSDIYKRSFGLDLAAYNGPGRIALPVPGTYVIDRTGTVRAAYANTNYRQRMAPADIVAALAEIE